MLCCLLCLGLTVSALAQQASKVTVAGTVADASGEPVIGASVVPLDANGKPDTDSGLGTMTDFDGKFSITVTKGTTVQVSYPGCTPNQFRALSNESAFEITLQENNRVLDEVVVVGYGVQKKKLITGSTINVSGDDILKQNTTHAIGALYSSVPGVNITQNTGQPWDGYNITVRGLNTTGSSAPLYVIDGIAGGSISSLNPADIESIDILKDAASAAIYGARASGGVILVTTRQGSKGKVNVTYDGYYSIQKAKFNGVQPVGGAEYIDLIDRSFVSQGALQEGQSYWDLNALMPVQYAKMQAGTWDGTNWLKESENKNALAYNHAIGINGGNDMARYSMGFSHAYTEGTLGAPKDTYYRRTTIRMNTDFTLWRLNGREMLKVGENATFSYYTSRGASTGNMYGNDIHSALTYTPLLPAYDDDGTFYTYEDQIRDGWNQADGAYNRLEAASLGDSENKTYRVQANAWLEFTPYGNWKFRSVYGFRYYNNAYRKYTPAYVLSGTNQNDYDDVEQSSSLNTNWSWENTLYWGDDFGEHHVDALIGNSVEGTGWGMGLNGTRQQTKFGTWESANLGNCESDIDPEMVSIGGWNTVPYKDLLSWFGRVNYNWKETYLLTVVLRYDGSCNFASGHRYGWFPSVAAGWIMTNEKWMESTRKYMDFLKLRASWGKNGNASISNFQYLASVSLNAPYDFTANGMSTSTGAFPDIIPNANLTWEKTEQIDLGIDARFLNNRLGFTFDWYRKDTKDWLVTAPILDTYGTGAPTINGGAVRNQGIEIGLNWNDRVGEVRYSAGVNFSWNRNRVQHIDNADGILHGESNVIQNINKYNLFEAKPGKPIGYFAGLASEGIFQNQAQIDAYNEKGYAFIDGYDKAQPGDVIWIDQNEDGIYDRDDVVEIGDPHPDMQLGVNLSASWRGFDVMLSGSGAFGQQVFQSYRQFGNSETENYATNFVKRLWTGEGSTNSFPRFTHGKHNNFYANGFYSDVWLQDADYFKLRTITVGYDFKQLFKRLPMQQLRVYFTGQNLLTFTGYDGMDPEVGYGAGYSWASGIDIGYYPAPKSYIFGLSVKF